MTDTKPTYLYMKRAPERDADAWVVFREYRGDHYIFQKWQVDCWEDGMDSWWYTRQEYDYWDITEEEAMEEIAKITARQQEFIERKRREDAEAMQQILAERAAERAARQERDDWSALETAAIAVHEMFVALCDAGFTEDQAISLVAKTMIKQSTGDDEAA